MGGDTTMSIEISEKQFALAMMAIDLALKWALRQSNDDIDTLLAREEKRKDLLMARLKGGDGQ